MYRSVMRVLALTFAPAVLAAQQPCTTDARQVVNEIYRPLLERPTDAGSVHWVQQLENGRMTVRDLVRELAKSNEHTQRFWRQESGEEAPYVRAVGTLYRHILGRQPDAEGEPGLTPQRGAYGPRTTTWAPWGGGYPPPWRRRTQRDTHPNRRQAGLRS